MPDNRVVLTHKGVQELEEKLEYLKTVRRQEISEQIKEARAFGDISENAEYDEAKNEQAKIEGEIIQIEKMLRGATVVDEEAIDLDVVNVGSKVKVLDLEFDEEDEYWIVGSAEADVSTNKISNESPVGKTLIGTSVGQTVEVETPSGIVKFKVIDISR